MTLDLSPTEISPVACPSDDELSGFHRGTLPDDRLDAVAAHVEACGRCEILLQRLDGEEGSVDAVLRRTYMPATEAYTKGVPRIGEAAGSVIGGRYTLDLKLGEGGMGVVWRAQQTSPVRRAVALKLVRAGLDSNHVLARFGAERQALALMAHPNIAQVLDAGSTDTGRPFFVMELVEGVPITKYCDGHRLTPRERLELFVPVCHAIQHAHQKGVIHRDIKPGNVLVAEHDGRPVPKVIDFGVAKAAGSVLSDETLVTGVGALVGTPEYMSPEQAELDQPDVDTRADVYALGVMLYELLTGSTPVDRRLLRDAALLEVLRVVREDEPPAPSTRLMSLSATDNAALVRGTLPRRLAAEVRGELDWVVMKALEKDRGRRYETASGLARDLERYLSGAGVEAGPPGVRYRVGKFARKYRKGIAAVVTLGLVLVAAPGVSVWQALRAREAQRLAENESASAVEANRSAQEESARASRAEELAQIEARRATRAEQAALKSASDAALDRDEKVRLLKDLAAQEKKVSRDLELHRATLMFFLEHVLEANPPGGQDGGPGRNITLKQAIDSAVPKISASFGRQPLTEATVRRYVGRTLLLYGDIVAATAQHEKSLALREKYLGPSSAATLQCVEDLALVHQAAGRLPLAGEMFEKVLAARVRGSGPDTDDALQTELNLAGLERRAGDRAKAMGRCRRVLETSRRIHGPASRLQVSALETLAFCESDLGLWVGAADHFAEFMEMAKNLNVLTPVKTHWPRHMWALALSNANRHDRAAAVAGELFEELKRIHSLDHPVALRAESLLVTVFVNARRDDEALKLAAGQHARLTRQYGRYHPLAAQYAPVLAMLHLRHNRPADAAEVFDAALPFLLGEIQRGRHDLAPTLAEAGRCLLQDGRLREASAALSAAIPVLVRSGLAEANLLHLTTLRACAEVQLGRHDLAEAVLRRVLEGRTPDASVDVRIALAETLLARQKWSEAEKEFRLCEPQAKGWASRYRLVDGMARICAATSRPDEAASWRARRERLGPEPAATPRG